jgi:hypothetical protein
MSRNEVVREYFCAIRKEAQFSLWARALLCSLSARTWGFDCHGGGRHREDMEGRSRFDKIANFARTGANGTGCELERSAPVWRIRKRGRQPTLAQVSVR